MGAGRGRQKKKRKASRRKKRTLEERHNLGFSATTRAAAKRKAK